MNQPPLKKVRPGDPLQISAPTYNAFVDAARDFQERRFDTGSNSLPDWQQGGVVLVRNDSGGDRGRFDVLGINGVLIDPSDNEAEFVNRVAVAGVVPTEDHVGRFVVLLEPVKSGSIGRACIDGVHVARVEMVDEDHTYADIEVGTTAQLVSSTFGSVRLLWIQPEEDRGSIAWCIVRLSSPGGSGISIMRVTSRTDVGLKLGCKHIDESGTPVGDELEVLTLQIDTSGLAWSEVTPSIAVGDDISAAAMSPYGMLYCLCPIIGTCELPTKK
jgi:hypothetical protein